MTRAIQKDRILRFARNAGPAGVDRTQFSLPDVVDGGAPILNFPGRIKDLRDDGYDLVPIGRRRSCRVYALADQLGARRAA